MKDRFIAVAIGIVAVSSLVVGWIGDKPPVGAPQASSEQFVADLIDAIEIIRQNYVETLTDQRLLYNSIRTMLHTLDPHSIFFDPREFARLREEEHSTYYGLGITVRRLKMDSGRSVVIEPPVAGSPADRLGIRAGDVLTHIDGAPLDNLAPDQIMDRLRGARGTWVTITLERPGIPYPLRFRIERDEIPIATVPYAFEVKPGVAYIKIERFSESTVGELKQKLGNLNAGRLSGLLLDLRNNPGGLLTPAIEVVDLFLPRGQTIVSTKGRARGSDHLYRTVSLNKIHAPMVVLINGHSASASEIVAGALQDHDRALIVGGTSFGKGLVQSVYRLGSDTGMALTTARYYTPSGRQIQRDYTSAGMAYFLSGGLPPSAGQPREARKTDSGRVVFGGGGITPDIEEPAATPNRFQALLTSKQVFFEYARQLILGQVPAAGNFAESLKKEGVDPRLPRKPGPRPQLEINDAVMDDFVNFLRRRSIEFRPEEIRDNLDYIKRGIRQEVYTISFGRQEGQRIVIQSDNQVRRALEALPAAKSLLATGNLVLPAPRPAVR